MSRAGDRVEFDPAVRVAWEESFLGNIPDAGVRRELLSNAVISPIGTGHVVQESDILWRSEPHPVSLVVDGVFRCYLHSPNGRQATVQYLRPGDTWGIVRTLSDKPLFEHHVLFQALVPSRILLIRGATFMSAVQAHPSVGLALARELARIVTLRSRALETNIFSDTTMRVAQHIVQLAVKDPSTGIPTVWLSQQEMADAAGTVREVVARIIGQLRARGMVQYSGRRLEILDMDALTREGQVTGVVGPGNPL